MLAVVLIGASLTSHFTVARDQPPNTAPAGSSDKRQLTDAELLGRLDQIDTLTEEVRKEKRTSRRTRAQLLEASRAVTEALRWRRARVRVDRSHVSSEQSLVEELAHRLDQAVLRAPEGELRQTLSESLEGARRYEGQLQLLSDYLGGDNYSFILLLDDLSRAGIHLIVHQEGEMAEVRKDVEEFLLELREGLASSRAIYYQQATSAPTGDLGCDGNPANCLSINMKPKASKPSRPPERILLYLGPRDSAAEVVLARFFARSQRRTTPKGLTSACQIYGLAQQQGLESRLSLVSLAKVLADGRGSLAFADSPTLRLTPR